MTRPAHRTEMNLHRTWCFLIHRWWVLTAPEFDGYRCVRCGELWSRR